MTDTLTAVNADGLDLVMSRLFDANAASGRPMCSFCARSAAPALNRPKLTE